MIKINSPSAKRGAMDYLRSLPENGEYMVIIGPTEDLKSKAQRSYAHLCMGIVAKHTGETLEAVKERIKERLPFAYAESPKRMKRLVDAIAKVVPEVERFRKSMLKLPMKERSSEAYNKAEYAAFIEEIFIEAANAEVKLPQPNYEI